MRPLPSRLSDFPWVVARLSCKLCPRRGQYRIVRLAARYGPDVARLMAKRGDLKITEIRSALIRECPRRSSMTDQCALSFVDLPDMVALRRERGALP